MNSEKDAGQDNISLLPKARGAFLGAAVGDALGWPQERIGRNISAVRDKRGEAPVLTFRQWARRSGSRFYPHIEKVRAGEYSDDTQLLLCTARSLIHGQDPPARPDDLGPEPAPPHGEPAEPENKPADDWSALQAGQFIDQTITRMWNEFAVDLAFDTPVAKIILQKIKDGFPSKPSMSLGKMFFPKTVSIRPTPFRPSASTMRRPRGPAPAPPTTWTGATTKTTGFMTASISNRPVGLSSPLLLSIPSCPSPILTTAATSCYSDETPSGTVRYSPLAINSSPAAVCSWSWTRSSSAEKRKMATSS